MATALRLTHYRQPRRPRPARYARRPGCHYGVRHGTAAYGIRDRLHHLPHFGIPGGTPDQLSLTAPASTGGGLDYSPARGICTAELSPYSLCGFGRLPRNGGLLPAYWRHHRLVPRPGRERAGRHPGRSSPHPVGIDLHFRLAYRGPHRRTYTYIGSNGGLHTFSSR